MKVHISIYKKKEYLFFSSHLQNGWIDFDGIDFDGKKQIGLHLFKKNKFINILFVFEVHADGVAGTGSY